MEGEGKGDRHQHGQKPRIPAWNSPSEEVMEHWTPTGAEPMEQWMDGINTEIHTFIIYITDRFSSQLLTSLRGQTRLQRMNCIISREICGKKTYVCSSWLCRSM